MIIAHPSPLEPSGDTLAKNARLLILRRGIQEKLPALLRMNKYIKKT
jgi:hypothetical protein